MKNIARIMSIVLLILWMITVFLFSAQDATASSEVSGGLTETVLKILKVPEEHMENAETLIRKLAHFSIYAIGGMIIFWHIGTYKISILKAVLLSQTFGILYAITDEIHQYFVPGRACQLRDVTIDTLGVATGIVAMLIINKIRREK